MEAEILSEIKEAERKAEEITERAKRQKEAILNEANIKSLKLIAVKEEELIKIHKKKIMDFRDKVKLLKEEEIIEGKKAAKQLKAKAEKNIPKAVEFVIKKFGEMI